MDSAALSRNGLFLMVLECFQKSIGHGKWRLALKKSKTRQNKKISKRKRHTRTSIAFSHTSFSFASSSCRRPCSLLLPDPRLFKRGKSEGVETFQDFLPTCLRFRFRFRTSGSASGLAPGFRRPPKGGASFGVNRLQRSSQADEAFEEARTRRVDQGSCVEERRRR